MDWIAIVIIVILVVWIKQPKSFEKLKGSSGGQKLKFSDPKISIPAGIIISNVVIWKMIPWLWSIFLHRGWWGLIILNVALWLVFYFGTITAKESRPTISKLTSIITFVLVLGLVTSAWCLYPEKNKEEQKMGYGQARSQRSQQAFSPGVISMRPSFEGVTDSMDRLTSLRPKEKTRIESLVTAPVDSWSGLIEVPSGAGHIFLDDSVHKFSVRWNGGIVEDFPQEEGVASKTPARVDYFQLRSRETGAVDIEVRFY